MRSARFVQGHASVAVVKPGKPMRTASLRKLGEAVGKVAERGSRGHGDHAECSYGDTRACIYAVQQEDQSGYRGCWNCEQGDANNHSQSVDHVAESTRRASVPRPKPRKKPKAVARSTSR